MVNLWVQRLQPRRTCNMFYRQIILTSEPSLWYLLVPDLVHVLLAFDFSDMWKIRLIFWLVETGINLSYADWDQTKEQLSHHVRTIWLTWLRSFSSLVPLNVSFSFLQCNLFYNRTKQYHLVHQYCLFPVIKIHCWFY